MGHDVDDEATSTTDAGGCGNADADDESMNQCIMDINFEGDESGLVDIEGDESVLVNVENADCAEVSVDALCIDETSLSGPTCMDDEDMILSLQEQICKLEEEKKELEDEKKELMEQQGGLVVVATQLASANVELVEQNKQLVHTIQEHTCGTVKVTFGANSIVDDDDKTCFYTGLPTYAIFITLFNLLKQFHPGSANINYFFATLLYLRLNPPMDDIGYRFGDLARSSVSRIFHRWIDIMYKNLKPLIVWPDTETLRTNLPEVFRKHFSKTKCIIDCFEIFIERPLSFSARAATYSNYKKHNTVKVLIAVAPTGAIVFISKAWGGRVSDKVITQKCGFLDHVEYGDVILADRGFNIHDDLAICGARLDIPSFTKEKTQLSRAEVEKSRQLARVRIHVERVIGQMRKKFKILQGTLPLSLVKRPTDRGVATIDKILVVTAALTNLSQSVVRA